MITMDTVEEILKRMRKSMVTMRIDLGLSQDKLDEMLGLATGSVGRYERYTDEEGNIDPYCRCNTGKFGKFYQILRELHNKKSVVYFDTRNKSV